MTQRGISVAGHGHNDKSKSCSYCKIETCCVMLALILIIHGDFMHDCYWRFHFNVQYIQCIDSNQKKTNAEGGYWIYLEKHVIQMRNGRRSIWILIRDVGWTPVTVRLGRCNEDCQHHIFSQDIHLARSSLLSPLLPRSTSIIFYDLFV